MEMWNPGWGERGRSGDVSLPNLWANEKPPRDCKLWDGTRGVLGSGWGKDPSHHPNCAIKLPATTIPYTEMPWWGTHLTLTFPMLMPRSQQVQMATIEHTLPFPFQCNLMVNPRGEWLIFYV